MKSWNSLVLERGVELVDPISHQMIHLSPQLALPFSQTLVPFPWPSFSLTPSQHRTSHCVCITFSRDYEPCFFTASHVTLCLHHVLEGLWALLLAPLPYTERSILALLPSVDKPSDTEFHPQWVTGCASIPLWSTQSRTTKPSFPDPFLPSNWWDPCTWPDHPNERLPCLLQPKSNLFHLNVCHIWLGTKCNIDHITWTHLFHFMVQPLDVRARLLLIIVGPWIHQILFK